LGQIKDLIHNVKLNYLYCSPDIIRVIKSRRMKCMHVYVARMGGRKRVYRVLVWKHKGKRPIERPRRGREDNIKIHIQEVRCEAMDWMELAQDTDRCLALENAVMNLRVL